jgi:hypothetical protein
MDINHLSCDTHIVIEYTVKRDSCVLRELEALTSTQCLRGFKILSNVIKNFDPEVIGFDLKYIYVGFVDNTAIRTFVFMMCQELQF